MVLFPLCLLSFWEGPEQSPFEQGKEHKAESYQEAITRGARFCRAGNIFGSFVFQYGNTLLKLNQVGPQYLLLRKGPTDGPL